MMADRGVRLTAAWSVLVLLSACSSEAATPTTTTLSPPVTVLYHGRSLDCPEWAAHAEGSNVGYSSELDAVQESLTLTIWPNARLEEVEPDRWRGMVDGRTVVLLYVEESDDGTWEWGGLAFCPS